MGKISKINKLQVSTCSQDFLVRYLLCKRLDIRNKELIFGVNEYNKPFLSNNTNIQFNILLSSKWIAYTVDNFLVWIDIDLVKSIDMSVAERFFSKEEVESLMNKCIMEREASFVTAGV